MKDYKLSSKEINLLEAQIRKDAKIALNFAMDETISNNTENARLANKIAVKILKQLNEEKSETIR